MEAGKVGRLLFAPHPNLPERNTWVQFVELHKGQCNSCSVCLLQKGVQPELKGHDLEGDFLSRRDL